MKCIHRAVTFHPLINAWQHAIGAARNHTIDTARLLSSTPDNLTLRTVLEALNEACTPTKADADRRSQLIADVQRTLDRIYTRGRLRAVPFGSYVSSLYEPHSDLDLVICGQVAPPLQRNKAELDAEHPVEDPEPVPLRKMKRQAQVKLLKYTGKRLLIGRVAAPNSVEVLDSARVPIIKFTSARTGLQVDICLADDAVPFKARTIRHLVEVHPAFAPLYRVVKVWANAQTINDGAAHMFNSWCLNLLIVFFFQKHHQPPLLPPIKELMKGFKNPQDMDRIMQRGWQPTQEELDQAIMVFARNAASAREVYSTRPSKPLDELFADFVESGARMLQSVLKADAPFDKGGIGISVWHGDYAKCTPFNPLYHMYVEDPYDSADNTARTLRKLKNKGREGTLHYITAVFERAARRLGRPLKRYREPRVWEEGIKDQAALTPSPAPAKSSVNDEAAQASAMATTAANAATTKASANAEAAPETSTAVAAVAASPVSAPPVTTAGTGTHQEQQQQQLQPQPAGPSSVVASAGTPSRRAPRSAVDPSLAPTLMALFGTELLTRLPKVGEQLLGRPLAEWAMGRLKDGRPSWEVHEQLLQRMGAASDFETFRRFRRRNKVEVHNELKYATPEEVAVVQPLLQARLTRSLTKAERRLIKLLRKGEQLLPLDRKGLDGAGRAAPAPAGQKSEPGPATKRGARPAADAEETEEGGSGPRAAEAEPPTGSQPGTKAGGGDRGTEPGRPTGGSEPRSARVDRAEKRGMSTDASSGGDIGEALWQCGGPRGMPLWARRLNPR